jgi:hypothetical protein
MMAQRIFVKFHLDVGVGDVALDPLEQADDTGEQKSSSAVNSRGTVLIGRSPLF